MDVLLQKEFTVDFLQRKMKKNEGEVPQYYVEGNHEAIISPAVFAQAAVKSNTLLRNGAYGIVMRRVHFCTRGCASLRDRNSASLHCIILDTAT